MKFWNMSLMTRLVSSFLFLSLVTVILAGYLAFISAKEALNRSVIDRLTLLAAREEDHLNHWLDTQRREVIFLASLPEVRAGSERLLDPAVSEADFQSAYERMHRFLASTITIKPDLQEVFILTDHGGKIVLSTDKTHEGRYRVLDSFSIRGRLGTYIQTVFLRRWHSNPP